MFVTTYGYVLNYISENDADIYSLFGILPRRRYSTTKIGKITWVHVLMPIYTQIHEAIRT